MAAPTVTIDVADTAIKLGEVSLVTFTFSEAVTGFDSGDLTIGSGTLSTLTTADDITWTATLTPNPTTAATNVITVDLTGVTDSGAIPGVGTQDSGNYAVDTVLPTATTIVVADTALKVGETSTVTITFSEAVTGFDNADLTIDNGTLSAVASTDGGVTWTATLTPIAGITDTTNIIRLDNVGVEDGAGNTGTATTDSNNYAVDTVERPTATIVVADTALNVGETSGVTITFSEAVTGFDNADLTVANGTLSAVSSTDGVTWTATLTPTAAITDTTNLITLDNTGVTGDVSGNPGAGTTESNNYAIDTTVAPPAPPEPPPELPVDLPSTSGPDVIAGNELSNVILAGDANDSATGGIGADSISGEGGADFMQGNVGADSLTGGVGADLMLGGRENDFAQGNTDADYVSGDKGDDTVHGGQGSDIVYGGEGDDAALGDRDSDTVRGGQGNDVVLGGDGDDYVSGDRGSDTVSGGLGADLFHGSDGAGVDLVTDFSLAEGDRVMLDLGTTYTLAQVGADTVIDMGLGNQMVLANVQLATLTPGWIFLG